MTTVLVTGATGNVGVRLVDALVADPTVHQVVALARRTPDGKERAGVRWVAVDLEHDELAPPLQGVDAVIHLAWKFQPMRDPEVTWRANVAGTRRLLDAISTSDVQALVHSSSVGVYSPAHGRMVDESWPTDGGACAYGREKAAVERMLDHFELGHPERRVVRMRPAFILQRRSAAQQRRLFAGPLLRGFMLRPGLLPVMPWPRGLRVQTLHTIDAAEAFRLAVERDVSGAFNLAADPVIGPDDVAELLHTRAASVPPRLARAAIGAGWHTRTLPTAPDVFDMAMELPLLDSSRARAELGWHPEVRSLSALDDVLQGMRAGTGEGTPPLSS